MGTKNNPGNFNCYAAAMPDEPIFILMGRDPAAPVAMEFWIEERQRLGKAVDQDDLDKIEENRTLQGAFRRWREQNLNGPNGYPTWKEPRYLIDSDPPIRMDLSEAPSVPDHRFGEMFKGRHYAYARGLTINPTHLPGALDEMERDGFTLIAIFGQTNSQDIGFIFHRHDQLQAYREMLPPGAPDHGTIHVEGLAVGEPFLSSLDARTRVNVLLMTLYARNVDCRAILREEPCAETIAYLGQTGLYFPQGTYDPDFLARVGARLEKAYRDLREATPEAPLEGC